MEVPFDALDRSAGTIEVKLAGIPKEKLQQLVFSLEKARLVYWQVGAKTEAAALAASDQVAPSDETDLHKALQVIQAMKDDEIKPAIKRTLRFMVEDLLRKNGDEKASDDTMLLGYIRELCLSNGAFGAKVLAFSEALLEARGTTAQQLVTSSFLEDTAEAMRVLHEARLQLVKFGVVGHRGIIGELTLDDGSPLLEDGQPKEAEIPFEASTWRWGKEKRPCVGEETLTFYRDCTDDEGLVLSLSEAVLLWQKGMVPSCAQIWDAFLKPEAPQVVEAESTAGIPQLEEEPPSRDGDGDETEAPVPFVNGE